MGEGPADEVPWDPAPGSRVESDLVGNDILLVGCADRFFFFLALKVRSRHMLRSSWNSAVVM